MKTIFVLLALAFSFPGMLAAAGDKPAKSEPAKAGIVGSSWLAEDIGNKGVIDNARTFVHFLSKEKVAGSGGVNRFSGTCKLDGANLKFGTFAVTRMAGPPAVMNQETAFLAALAKVASYKLDEHDILHFLDKDGAELVRLARSDGDPKDLPEKRE
jgi:heat shock protein HslJ